MTQPLPQASQLLAALERCWDAIRESHPEVPGVVVILGAGAEGRRAVTAGHFIEARWLVPKHGTKAEVMIAGELLACDAAEIFGTLLHEAVHALADARRVPDTSQHGRYHNQYFARVAGELGLDVRHETIAGWHCTSLRPETQERFAAAINDLAAVQAATLHMRRSCAQPAQSGGPEVKRARVFRLTLKCTCPRIAYASQISFSEGPILCGTCGDPFVPSPIDTKTRSAKR